METGVIIPALNEAGHIQKLVRDTLKTGVELVVVVDNGSTDQTAKEARSGGAHLITEHRTGYGFACAAGAAIALREGVDWLVFMDGDYSCDPNQIDTLIKPLKNNQADLVLGSRTLGSIESGAMPVHPRLGNWVSALLMRRIYGIEVTDLGPFRAIRATFFHNLKMDQMTYGWPTEMTVKVARASGRIVEVPVSWRNRQGGRSKISGTLRGSLLAGYYILGVIIWYALFNAETQ
ncbi:MAG: glycosyltransferase family 2 protein [Anaerolineae bacterium]|nr:glycosyltransferase family 2 protein [Anaerolineae bacterium]